MPQYLYRGRDKEGRLRAGQRFSANIDILNSDLIKEGISPIQIKLAQGERSFVDKIQDFLQGESLHVSDLSIFARQMQLLHDAGVPIVTALKQLSTHVRSRRLHQALQGVIGFLEQGQSLATAMQNYPAVFSPLITNIIQIGENTGQLSNSFNYIHQYLDFEATTRKQIKAAFRYPIFVLTSITLAIIVLNLFVIPTFAKFYVNLEMSLPWQTRLLISTSNFFTGYGWYLLIALGGVGYWIHRYLKTAEGKYRWNKFELRIPFLGHLLKRIILIRFCQSMSIILSAGLSVTQGLGLVTKIIPNAYIVAQINQVQELIERGVPFTQAITNIDLFTSFEIQILAVGEKNGELSPALNYISTFHAQEIEYDLKRMNDIIGPLLIGAVSGLILIIALGVYLPIWNMVNLAHTQ